MRAKLTVFSPIYPKAVVLVGNPTPRVWACVGAIVDATLIAGSGSTKNRTRQPDPQMHHTKKAKQWYFGMKAHIGVDADSGVVQHVLYTSQRCRCNPGRHGSCMVKKRWSVAKVAIPARINGRNCTMYWHSV